MLRSHIVVNSPLRPKFLLKCKIATALLCWRIRDSAKNQRSSTLVLNSTRAWRVTAHIRIRAQSIRADPCLKLKRSRIYYLTLFKRDRSERGGPNIKRVTGMMTKLTLSAKMFMALDGLLAWISRTEGGRVREGWLITGKSGVVPE